MSTHKSWQPSIGNVRSSRCQFYFAVVNIVIKRDVSQGWNNLFCAIAWHAAWNLCTGYTKSWFEQLLKCIQPPSTATHHTCLKSSGKVQLIVINNGMNILQWNLIIMRTLGPQKLPCYIRFLITSRHKNIESWDQQNYLVIRGSCYICGPLYNKVPLCYIHVHVVKHFHKSVMINMQVEVR